MFTREIDVIILGAGAAGLAAARDLSGAGISCALLEARNRMGGRIHTLHDPAWPVPVEIGAEFVHGKPPDTWRIIRAAGLAACEVRESHHHFEHGRLIQKDDFW